MKIEITIDEAELTRMVLGRLEVLMPSQEINPLDMKIEVKSTQNYKAEWEPAQFRVRITKETNDF